MKRGIFALFAVWCVTLAIAGTEPVGPAIAGRYDRGPAEAGLDVPLQQSTRPAAAQSGPVESGLSRTSASPHGALLTQYCITCHNERAKTGGLVLDAADLATIPNRADVWEKVIRKVRAGMMPPVGMPRPDQAALDGLVAHLETTLDKAALASPALRRTAMHRLNRAEYGNAIRDLFDLEVDVSALLPPDEEAYGFDNNALVLNVSPALMERYLSAAWKISSLAVASPKITPTLETFRVRGDLSQDDHVPGLPIGTRGGIQIRH